jgi:hypothetical protein
MADLLNIPLAENEGEDSFSFLPLLMDNDPDFARAPIVNHSGAGMFAIRRGKYKLVLGNGSGGRQIPKGRALEKPYMLFDLDVDISETTNTINENRVNSTEYYL